MDHTGQENLWFVGCSTTARATSVPGESVLLTNLRFWQHQLLEKGKIRWPNVKDEELKLVVWVLGKIFTPRQ